MLEALEILFADRKIGTAAKMAYLQLWMYADEQPGHVIITADWLAGRLGRRPRSAWDWLADLEKHDLIKIGERNERRGSVEIFVYSPAPGKDREATPDPQMRMDLQTGNAADREATPDPPMKHAPQSDGGEHAGVCAQEPPSRVIGGPGEAAGVSAQKPPRPLVPKKIKDLTYQSTKATKVSKDTKDTMEGTATASVAASEDKFSCVEAFSAITATLDVAPTVQKDRLKAKIRSVCGDVSDWVAGSAANLVVYQNVPEADLLHILKDVQAMREVGSLQDAGAFFHFKARKLAKQHGKPWPRRNRQG